MLDEDDPTSSVTGSEDMYVRYRVGGAERDCAERGGARLLGMAVHKDEGEGVWEGDDGWQEKYQQSPP
ncbi:hypothetical protein GUJ93_ZPchr0066g46487 [Zizania palustris]|uniref:Uncharacterized protein n=1 Tax=Zizania palustris TaxID=103762 RepID=A0A8J5UVE4_ZIZPA|nr:hypothetical protein GUJ93_ZPchr0066g46487 [Zizania palustris]